MNRSERAAFTTLLVAFIALVGWMGYVIGYVQGVSA